MPATRDGKLWRSQFYYKDWQGVRRKKNKRGFKTKGEADEWERNFLQQQQKNLDISFENFVEIYFADMENRLRESTIINKRYVFDLKVTPYFKHKKMCEIQTSDIRAWQNELIKKGYAPTYLKSINNQLAALFNYAVRYYDLRDNPCRKAGSIGKSKADEMDFWTKQEFKEFLPSMDSKPEARMAFLLLYWTGMRIGELLALTYEDIDLEKRCITINKSYQRLNGKDMITPPKTPKSNRQIAIPPFLAEELKEVKELFTDTINRYVKEESEKLSVFQQGGVYLATKKIGKNNPKAEEIKADKKQIHHLHMIYTRDCTLTILWQIHLLI